ncbi:hypothetical protein [Salmonella enterica]|uniref:hypothetical protein n=1 Tax=Salmonella enterica TaxID=28901 RepID=UPI0015C584AE|nr:hypothetical protein [Salmonella enterica]
MNAGTPKTGAWRGVVVVRHFVALSAGRERSRILAQIDGHAAAKPDVFAGRSP